MAWRQISSSALLLASLIAFSSGSAAPRQVTAVRVQQPPKIDGRLDDPCWKLARPASGFIQMDPDEGKPATEQTSFRVVYDQENLYIGIECLDSRPDKIVARLVPRDSNFWPGDVVGVVLDTFGDQQNCYGFAVNPKGVQRDYRSAEDGSRGWGGIDLAWDGLWYSAAQITDKGWTAELAIPFKTVRFSRKRSQLWGINLHRYQSSKREDSHWSFISRDDGSMLKVSKAGTLIGLEDITPGLHIKLLPYGTTKYERKTDNWKADTGLNLKYGITSDFTLDVTLNPDFCHIEADEERINLTRFELFYEEKRPFFLERSELFTPMNLFYSRRIADPRFGVKLTGTSEGWSLGLLGAVDEEEGPDPTYGVIGLKRDILENSSLGIVGVAKQKTKDQWSRAVGLELGLRPGNSSLSLNLARSFNPGIKKEDWKASLWLGHFTDRFFINGGFSLLEPEFCVDRTGYVPHDPHVGQKELNGGLGYRFYLNRFGIWRVALTQYASATKRTDEERWGWHWKNLGLRIDLESRNAVDLCHQDWYFRWHGKGYRGETFSAWYKVSGKAFIREGKIGAQIEDHYDWADDYFGKIKMVYLWVDTNPSGNLALDLNGRVVWEYYPSGKLDEVKHVENLRVTYLPRKDIFLRAFLPLNPTAKQYALNFLFSWAYRPMSRLYLAYNEQRGEDMKLADRIIIAKLSYLWNL